MTDFFYKSDIEEKEAIKTCKSNTGQAVEEPVRLDHPAAEPTEGGRDPGQYTGRRQRKRNNQQATGSQRCHPRGRYCCC